MPPHQEQSRSYTALRLKHSVQGNHIPHSEISYWTFLLWARKWIFHGNAYLLLLFKHSIKNVQSTFKSRFALAVQCQVFSLSEQNQFGFNVLINPLLFVENMP